MTADELDDEALALEQGAKAARQGALEDFVGASRVVHSADEGGARHRRHRHRDRARHPRRRRGAGGGRRQRGDRDAPMDVSVDTTTGTSAREALTTDGVSMADAELSSW